MKTLQPRNLLKSAAIKVHDMLFTYLAQIGAVLCVADAGGGDESLLTSGQDTTAATGDQATTDATKTADGAQSADAAKTEGSTGAAATGEEGKQAEGTKADEKPTGAPETYAAFNMPEGYVLDEQLLGEFSPVLKELNLSQEAAQKVIDFAPKLIERAAVETQAAMLEQLGLKDATTWAAASKVDPEFGGEKLAENLAVANKAMSAFFSPAAIGALKKVGLGNHPELIRGFLKVGKAISEDSFVPGGKNTSSQNPATRLYTESKMNP